ncbi:hypothetical protein ACVNIS_17990 [Sphaerotilaceae bacterium SBD11-9]
MSTQLRFRAILIAGALLPAVFFFAVSVVAPDDVQQRWPIARNVVMAAQSWTGKIIPRLDLYAHARSTSFPQVASLATALASLWWPLLTGIFLFAAVKSHRQFRKSIRARQRASQLFLLTVVSLPLAALCLFGVFSLPGDPGFASNLTTSSRLGYAVMGLLALLFSSLLVAVTPLLALSFFDSATEGNPNA